MLRSLQLCPTLLWPHRWQPSQVAMCLLVPWLCPPLCDPWTRLPGSYVHGILQARILVGCHSLLQGIFLSQGSNPGLLHCRKILYHLSYRGVPLCLLAFILHICVILIRYTYGDKCKILFLYWSFYHYIVPFFMAFLLKSCFICYKSWDPHFLTIYMKYLFLYPHFQS